MSRRQQIRLSVPDELFRELEKQSSAAYTSVPSYILSLVARHADQRANYMNHQAARWGILASMMSIHQMVFPETELTPKEFTELARQVELLIGDSPPPPPHLFSEGTHRGSSFFTELAQLYSQFCAPESWTRPPDHPWGRYCPTCRRGQG